MMSVLCVDDEESTVDKMKTHLGTAGDILVEGSASAAQALEMLRAHNYDAVVVRFDMHGMEGQRFLGMVRNRLRTAPVIFLMPKDAKVSVQKALASQTNVYVVSVPAEPDDFDEITALVRESVRSTRQQEFVGFAEFAAERMGIGTVGIERSGRISRFNKEVCKIFGYTEQEFLSKSVWDLSTALTKDDWPGTWKRLEESKLLTLESTGQRKDGSNFPVEILATKECIAGVDYLVGAVRDLTARKMAEARLRETVESYRTLAQNLPGIVYRVKVRENHRMIFFNDMLKPITGYDPSELEARDVCSIMPLIFEEDREAVRTKVQEAMRLGRTFEVQYRLRAKDGSVRYLVERGRPLAGTDGEPLYIDGVIFDVTDQKMAQAAEMELEQRLSRISDLVPAAIFEADRDGKIGFMNESTLAMTGYGRGEINGGKTWHDFVAPEDADLAAKLGTKAIAEGTSVAADIRLITKEGKMIPVSASWTPITSDGKVSRLVCMLVDVTRTKRTEKIQNAITRISQTFIAEPTLDRLYSSIHKILRELMPADNFFIAISARGKNELSFPYFVDEHDPRPEPRRLGNGITEYIIATGSPFLASGDDIRRMNAEGKFGIVGSMPHSFIGVPLMTKQGVIGAMAMQSYDAKLSYDRQELEILQFVSYQVAQAIERKRNEEEAQNSLALLKGVFESTADGLLIVDTNRKILAVNSTFAKMWCIPDAIANTMDDSRLLGFMADQLKDPQPFMERVNYLYDNPFEMDLDTLTFKDGRYFERYSQAYTSDGITIGRIWSFRDVTERKRAESALRQSETELKAIINSAKDIIFVKDTTGAYRMVNDAMLNFFGKSADYFLGKDATESFDADFAGQILPTDKQALEGITMETEMTAVVDGTTKVLSVIKAPLRSQSGEIVGICGIARDVTERKNVEKALKDANASLDILNSITRHDVLNQLMVIRGYSDLVRASMKDSKDIEHMDKIEKATRTIRSQIIFTKDFQKLGSAEPTWQLVEELFDSAFSTLEMGPVEISVDLGGLEIFADPMLEKVFYNLIDNSLRHGENVTRVSVTCRKEKGELVLTYADNGVGIKAGDKDRIFDRAYGKNTGLGLFLTKAILGVTAIGIEENGEPGNGARFEMHIPDGKFRFQEYDVR